MIENDNLLIIPDNTQYWFVRAGSKAEYFDDFAYNNYIAIGDNNIALGTLQNIELKYRATPDILKQRYKKIFKDSFINEYKENNDTKNMDEQDIKKDMANITRSASISAIKTYDFIEKMKIGDIILIPNNGSSNFRIGIITSNPFSDPIKHIFIPSDNDATIASYTYSNYDKKRRVAWIKDITEKDLPDKLLWIKSAHKAIFDVTNNAQSINPLIATYYFYKNSFYARIGVGTPNPISSTQWLAFQQVIVETTTDIADKVFQKHKVESIGQIILQTTAEHWDDILAVCIVLFGQVSTSIKGKEFHINGLLTNFYPSFREQKRHEKIMHKHEEEKAKLLIDGLKKDNTLKDLEIKERENKLIEQLTVKKTKKALLEHTKNDYSLNDSQKKILDSINLSDDPVGNEIPSKMQENNLNSEMVKHEKEKKQ